MNGEAGLENFTLIVPDRSFVSELALRMRDSITSKQINEDQLLLSDPDGLQFLIRSQEII